MRSLLHGFEPHMVRGPPPQQQPVTHACARACSFCVQSPHTDCFAFALVHAYSAFALRRTTQVERLVEFDAETLETTVKFLSNHSEQNAITVRSCMRACMCAWRWQQGGGASLTESVDACALCCAYE